MRIKSNKGFTLIELLLTIALLAIISIISFVSINAIINKNKDNECVATVNNIIIAAKEYYSDKRYEDSLTITNNKIETTASFLKMNNYLNGEITDPYEKETVNSANIIVTIYLSDNKSISDIKVTENGASVFNGCKSSNKDVMSGSRITRPETKSYQVNYLLNGGKLGANAPNSVLYETATRISNPTKTIKIIINNNSNPNANTEGSIISANNVTGTASFAGWSSNTSLGLGPNAKHGSSNNNITNWNGSNTKKEYFKYLRDDPGTVTMVANWQEPTITLPTIIKENHDCGWTTNKTGATIEYQSGVNYTPPTNTSKTTINLYPYCELGKYTITADANGGTIATTTGWTGTGSSATKIITYGESYDTLPTVSRTGFTFAGWYTANSGGTKVESSTSMTTGSNHTIYARWTANELTFNNQTLNAGTYGTAYTSNAFTGAANGTGNYTYTIKSGAPVGATINSTNRKITFVSTTTAGTYNVIIHVKDNTSGKEKDATMNITINKKSITPSISSCSNKTYNGNTAATCTIGVATIVSGDTITASGTCNFADKNVGTSKTVTCTGITISGSQTGNYSLSATSTSKASAANITKKSITPSISSCSNKTYNGNTAATCTIGVTTLVSGDTITASGTCNFADKNVGTSKTVTCTGITISGSQAGNYSLSATSTSKASAANITKKSITPSISSCSNKVYNGNTAATCTLGVTTIESGDTVTASGTCAFVDKNVGTSKTVTCTGITISGSQAGNYQLNATSTSKASAANITKKAITISAKNQSILCTGQLATGTGQITISSGALISGDSLTGVTITSSSANAFTGTITPSAATIKDNNGSGNAMTNNYNITYASGILTINMYELLNSGGSSIGYADTLSNAFANVVNNGTIKTLCNNTSGRANNSTNATLNTNGKTITLTSFIYNNSSATLNITSSTSGGAITTATTNHLLYNNGTLTTSSITLSNTTSTTAYIVVNYGTYNANGGTNITSSSGRGISNVNGTVNLNSNVNIDVYGYPLIVSESATGDTIANITGATLKAATSHVIYLSENNYSSTLNMSSGSIIVTATTGNIFGIYIDHAGNNMVNITGGLIRNNSNIGIYADTSGSTTINIGSNTDSFSQVNPKIIGKTYAIRTIGTSAKWNWYDGELYGNQSTGNYYNQYNDINTGYTPTTIADTTQTGAAYKSYLEKKYIATFYYQSNTTAGSTTIASTTASCTMSGTASSCNVTIPTIVRNSVGTWNNTYAGLSTSVGNMTQTISNNAASTSINANTTYYAIYRTNLTNYYYTNGYTNRVIYRNQWFVSTTSMASTVLSTASNGTSNYTTAVGPGNAVWNGLATSATTATTYSSVASAATSTATTLYTVYQFSVSYQIGDNVTAIGATTNSCKVTTGTTTCNVTLPSITAASGYISVGWNTTSGATTGTSAGATYSLSSTGRTLYANAKINSCILNFDVSMAYYELFELRLGMTGAFFNGGTAASYVDSITIPAGSSQQLPGSIGEVIIDTGTYWEHYVHYYYCDTIKPNEYYDWCKNSNEKYIPYSTYTCTTPGIYTLYGGIKHTSQII